MAQPIEYQTQDSSLDYLFLGFISGMFSSCLACQVYTQLVAFLSVTAMRWMGEAKVQTPAQPYLIL